MFNDKIIAITFLVSLMGHCLFLGIPLLKMVSFQPKNAKDITLKIEIDKPSLLPKIDKLGDEKKLRKVEKEIVPHPEESEPKQEEVILEESFNKPIQEKVEQEKIEIINPDEEEMLRYQDMIKQRIEQVRKYPSWAKEQEIEGIVHAKFVVLSNGLGRDIEIISSSGSKILDEEAIATIKRAHSFPPIPQELQQDSILMEVNIVFTLE